MLRVRLYHRSSHTYLQQAALVMPQHVQVLWGAGRFSPCDHLTFSIIHSLTLLNISDKVLVYGAVHA